MPTYVYKFIETGETIEVQQSFTDDTLTEAVHPESGEVKPVKKVFQPVGVTFKGDGFYKTDSRSASSTKSSDRSSSDSSSPAGDSSGSTGGDAAGSSGSSGGESSTASSTATSSSDGSGG